MRQIEIKNRIIKQGMVEWRKCKWLQPENLKKQTEEQLDKLKRSLVNNGFAAPLYVWQNKETIWILDGHHRERAMRQLESEGVAIPQTLPGVWLNCKNKKEAVKLCVVFMSQYARARESAILEFMQDFDPKDIIPEIDIPGLDLRLEEEEIQDDQIPEPPKQPVTIRGDIWTLGAHRLWCGDCTDRAGVTSFLGGIKVDLICTDPPYCAGGFQESGKSVGSVGTDAAHKVVANDRLSTRGYMALLKSAFLNMDARFLYLFTDWRMWVYLFDIVESSGHNVRSMVVWDKGTPGMGRGWRAQHELIMWACREVPPFDKYTAGLGNVISCKRTGNKNHTTEKPQELIGQLLGLTSEFCKTVADPFAGSGTTIIAAEQKEMRGFALELDPAYCDVIVERWQNLTGGKATRKSAA